MSDDRVIHTSDYNPHPDSEACRWLRANGVDPGMVPAENTITVTGGQITYSTFLHGPDGKLLQDPDPESGRFYLRELRTVPLIASPEAFGL